MIRLDPMVKLALIVAAGVAVTIALGIGQPKETDKSARLSRIYAKPVNPPQIPTIFKAADKISLDHVGEESF